MPTRASVPFWQRLLQTGRLFHRPAFLIPALCAALFQDAQDAFAQAPAAQAPAAQAPAAAESGPLLWEPKTGQRIAILGGAGAEAFWQDGFLETLFHGAFPKHQLVFRNLAVPGASVVRRQTGEAELREQWVRAVKADVVWLFCGAVESAAGREGLAEFTADAAAFVKNLGASSGDGKSPVKVVLVGPAARETHVEASPAEAARANEHLRAYSEALAGVAQKAGLPFVDLYGATLRLFETGPQRSALLPKRWGAPRSALSLSGGRLTAESHRLLASGLFEALTGREAQTGADLESLRRAVLLKNEAWVLSYRALAWGAPVAVSFDSLEEGLRSREGALWSLAAGGPSAEAQNPAAHRASAPSPEATAPLSVAPGFHAELFADEGRFRELLNPLQMDWDARGRLWVLCGEGAAGEAPRLLVFEDGDTDGRAEKAGVFAEGLAGASGFVLYRDGVLLNQAGDLWLLRDPRGTGRVEERERFWSGLGVTEPGLGGTRMALDPRGGVVLSAGSAPRTRLETAAGVLEARGGVYRFEPSNGRADVLVASGLPEGPGVLLDGFGNDFFFGAKDPWSQAGPLAYLWSENTKRTADGTAFRKQSPVPGNGMLFLSSSHFPEETQGGLLVCTDAAPAGVRFIKMRGEGSAKSVEGVQEWISSKEASFHPTCLSVAPDGALLFGEGSGKRGRIYRVTVEGRPLVQAPRVAGEALDALLELLKAPEEGTRRRARNAIATFSPVEVLGALQDWEVRLNPQDRDYERHRLEALWLSRWFDKADGVANRALLDKVLRSPEVRVRAQAVRLLAGLRRVLPDALKLLEAAAADADDSVRLEVLGVAGFFPANDAGAVRVVHRVLEGPLPGQLESLALETLRRLEPEVSRMLLPQNPAVLGWILDRLSNAELADVPGAELVWTAQVDRPAMDGTVREKALLSLAAVHRGTRASELAAAIERLEAAGDGARAVSDALMQLLLKSPVAELRRSAASVAKLAERVKRPLLRKSAHAAWILSAESPVQLWATLAGDAERGVEVLEALPRVADAGVRAAFQTVLAAELQSETRPSGRVLEAAALALPWTGDREARVNFELLCLQILRGRVQAEATQALAQLPVSAWKGWEVQKLSAVVASLSRWLEAVPERERAAARFATAWQVARRLSASLEEQAALDLRRLLELKTPVRVVRAVFGQGRFDAERLWAEPGEALELVFENEDAAPRNLVLVIPGGREAVLKAAAGMSPGDVDSGGRSFVPKLPGIVAASRVLSQGDSQTLKFTAPSKPGAYEFFSTVPGSPPLRGVLQVGGTPAGR
jgi:hypothetical protein